MTERQRDIDVTKLVDYELDYNDFLILLQCACGRELEKWELVVSSERDYPSECPNCKRKLYFKVAISVFEIGETGEHEDRGYAE